MARSKTIATQARWAGSSADVARLARTAAALLNEQAGSSAVSSITVELPGLENQYDSPEEFQRALTVRDVPRVMGVTTVIRDEVVANEFEIVIRLDEGARLTVAGPDRTTVEGITTRLREVIGEGCLAPWVNGFALAVGWGALAVSGLLIWFTVDGYNELPRRLQNSDGWFGLALVLTVFTILLISAALTYISPAFELLAPGAPTRFQRARAKWRWLVGVVVVAVIGALAAKFIK